MGNGASAGRRNDILGDVHTPCPCSPELQKPLCGEWVTVQCPDAGGGVAQGDTDNMRGLKRRRRPEYSCAKMNLYSVPPEVLGMRDLRMLDMSWNNISRRQVDRKTTMDRRDSSVGQQRRVMDFSIPDLPLSGHRPAAYDPSLYSHLPPHEQPLPPDPEDAWVKDLSHTLPLGSGSTQEWTSRQCQQREAGTTRESFTALLEEGVDDADTELVDLDFGLCSGSGASGPIHGGEVVGAPTFGGGSSRVDGPTNGCRPLVSSSMGAGPLGESSRAVTPTCPSVSSPAMRQRATASAAINDGTPPEDIGRQAWENCRQQMRRAAAKNITTVVSTLRVGSDVDADNSRQASGDESPYSRYEDDAEDGEGLEIRPVAARGGRRGGRGRQRRDGSRGGRGSKAPVGDKGGKHPAWSVEEMLKLARAKRDQQAHFEGMPHNYGRMRNREWKLLDLQKRLAEVGVSRATNDIGKKWDNVFQQYRKVQRYQNMSGGKNFFTLTPATRADEGFNFGMDERVFNEIDNMSKNNKTIYPDNVADTSARGGVLPAMDGHRQAAVGGESSAGGEGGDGVDEDVGSARELGFSAGSTSTPAKRTNMRQQTFNAITEVMDKHGGLMADTVEGASKRQDSILERQCDILDREVEAQTRQCDILERHYTASDEVNRMMCTAAGPSIPRTALTLGIWGGLPACGMGDRRCRRVEGCGGGRLGGIRAPREGKCHRKHYKGPCERYLVLVFWFSTARKATRGVSVVLRGELNIARARRSLATSSQALWQSAFVHGACASDRQRMAPRRQQKPKRPHGGSGEAGAGQTGRGHVPKSKKLHAGDGSKGEMGGDEGEEVTPMDITSAGTPALGFGRDGVSRQRMLALTNLGVLTSTRGGGGGTARPQGVLSGDIPPQRAMGSASTIASVSEPDDKAPVGESPSRHVEASNPKIVGASPRAVLQSAQAASAAGHAAALGIGERREDRRVEEAGRKQERREESPRGEEEDDQPLGARKKRSRLEEELEVKSKLWVDGKAFWATGPGRMIADVVHSYADYFCAIVNGDAGASAPQGLMMSPPEVPRVRIEDGAQREPALRRARRTENVAMRVIHGWIFRSSSRSDGFALVESYVATDYPTDLARAVWQSLEWSRTVSPTVVYHTVALKMDIPLWSAGVYIENRPEDDDMAAHQEATVMHLASCFHDALRAGQWWDGGDDERSYEEASYYAQLVAKPTLVAACSSSFNWRRHVMHSANAVLSRLRKPPLTLGAFPDYSPEWASCGVRYNCNAGLADLDVAARMDWMETGPFEGDRKVDSTKDETGA
ncbi:hypothetical protein CBR_g32206 [Chara braunii]|uniref:Myb-like domain-containing protein n=1 Tax=Chara braunii TaxID=69332 RepID=A0A388JMY6_CHABU|nr:hypothetical protein CBR_g32206 [Chara braunii]|eukprot:GBG59190.1 hypothetical protein CBR_g32206 [Chara braunii]